MGKIGHTVVVMMMALLAVGAADELEVAWQKYLVTFSYGVYCITFVGYRLPSRFQYYLLY